MYDFKRCIKIVANEAYILDNKKHGLKYDLKYYKEYYTDKFIVLESAVENFYLDDFFPVNYNRQKEVSLYFISNNLNYIKGCIDDNMNNYVFNYINDYFIKTTLFNNDKYSNQLKGFKGLNDFEIFIKLILDDEAIKIYNAMLPLYDNKDIEFFKLLVSSHKNKTSIDDSLSNLDFT